MDPMAAIRETFFVECEEQLCELESGLMALEQGDAEPDTLNAVFRAVHSIKGGAGAFALEGLVRYAHVFETVLDGLRAGRILTDGATLKLLLRAADVLADMVRASRAGSDELRRATDNQRMKDLSAELAKICAIDVDAVDSNDDSSMDDLGFQPVTVSVASSETEPQRWSIRFVPRGELYANGNDAAFLLRELARLGEIRATIDDSAIPDLNELDSEGAYLAWNITLAADVSEAQIREVFEFVEDDCGLELSQCHGLALVATPSLAPSSLAPSSLEPSDDDAVLAALLRGLTASATPEAPSATTAPPPPTLPVNGPPLPTAATPAEALAPVKPEGGSGATIRVDLDRVDRLIDLVGELVINEAMLSQRVLEAGMARASGVAVALDELAQLTREIQDSVMAIRAQPVRSVFQRMPRLVREVAAMTHKSVRLVTEGENTEVDKTVIERLADPLTHMIRNAIDHGIEAPDQRAACGKPAEGTVRLHAMHRSGRIVIEVSDDGAGIDRARVKAKAVEKGIVAADGQMSDDEIDNLIFAPGFSTASSISDISGRGVGMDVVKRSVQALGGRIGIASRPGQGSTFTLSLPLTLAVLDGMVVSVAGHTLIVPIAAVVETLQPAAADLHGVGHEVRLIALRGGFIPLLDVGVALDYRAARAPDERGVALLVEGEGRQRAVLLVDSIHGQRQVVIKSLEANYRAVPGIAAATVMGDGRVALILDVDALLTGLRSDRIDPVPVRCNLETVG